MIQKIIEWIWDILNPYNPDYLYLEQQYTHCKGVLSETLQSLKQTALEKASLEKQIEEWKSKYENETAANKELKRQVGDLKKTLSQIPKELIIPPAVQKWDTKYPEANIFYTRYIPKCNKEGKVDVRHFLTPEDPRLVNWVRCKNLKIEDPWNCNDIIAKIYKADRYYFKYRFDYQQFGVKELWLYPWETMTLKYGDCDDWANLLASRLLAAGLPPQRLRVVAGLTNNKAGGHATVYVLGDDFKTWYHLNSTGYSTHSHLEDYPTSHDEDDPLGVIGEHIWFAYSKHKAWHTFRTTEARTTYKKYHKKKWINIASRTNKRH